MTTLHSVALPSKKTLSGLSSWGRLRGRRKRLERWVDEQHYLLKVTLKNKRDSWFWSSLNNSPPEGRHKTTSTTMCVLHITQHNKVWDNKYTTITAGEFEAGLWGWSSTSSPPLRFIRLKIEIHNTPACRVGQLDRCVELFLVIAAGGGHWSAVRAERWNSLHHIQRYILFLILIFWYLFLIFDSQFVVAVSCFWLFP